MFKLIQQAVSLALIAGPFVPTIPAQNPAKPAPESDDRQFTFKATSDTVLVNIVVHDKKGNLVRGLKAEDFTLLEDGKPQHISAFDFEQIDMAVATPTQTTATPELKERAVATKAQPLAPLASTALDPNNKRLIVLFFDFTGMEIEEIRR